MLAGLLVPVEPRQPFNIVKIPDRVATQEKDKVHCADTTSVTGYCIEDAPHWTLAPKMPAFLSYGVSPFMAARWGLEGLSDMYVHDYAEDPQHLPTYDYSFKDLGAVYITFHSDDDTHIRSDIAALLAGSATPAQITDRGRDAELLPYCLVLGGFAFTMLLLTMAALKRKDYEMTRL